MKTICDYCQKEVSTLGQGNFAVTALDKQWHKECFKCKVCNKRLFSFSKFFESNGMPVCATCHQSDNPLCSGCKKSLDGKFIIAAEKSWHQDCFICSECRQPFTEGGGFVEDNGTLVHLQCMK